MAARRHWRFVVRDRYGFVIQNAKVNVFQPGTTNNFLGNAYNAASGGSAVSNPFTTNAQGEVEAWFDTEQTVDVRVDDNTNLAYRAVGGVTDIADFTTFTEADTIYPEGGDIQLEDVVPLIHGAVQHTNVTRNLWLPANDGILDGATLLEVGTSPNEWQAVQLDDAVNTDAVYWNFIVPDDWDSGVITATPVFVVSATVAASAVRWQYVAGTKAVGADITAAGTTTAWTGSTENHTLNIVYKDTPTSTGVTPAAAGDLFRLQVTRLGADALDTLNASIVRLVGVIISYTANQ